MAKLSVTLEPGIDGTFSYYAEQLLKGNVELSLNRVQKFRGLYVQLLGKGKADWHEGKIHYEGEEVYIDTKIYIFGEFKGPTLEMEQGCYRENFSFELPRQLPYSIKVRDGKIFYSVTAVLDIPRGFDKEAKTPFTILPQLNLSLHPHLSTAFEIEKVESFVSFGDSKALKILVTLPCIGFLIGQEVPVKIRYINNSKVDIKRTRITLKQHICLYGNQLYTYHRTGNKIMKKDVIKCTAGGVRAGSSNEVDSSIRIPQVMSSNDNFSKVIIVSYYLVIDIRVSGLHMNREIKIPITIGDVKSEIRDHSIHASSVRNELLETNQLFSTDNNYKYSAQYIDENSDQTFERAFHLPKM